MQMQLLISKDQVKLLATLKIMVCYGESFSGRINGVRLQNSGDAYFIISITVAALASPVPS